MEKNSAFIKFNNVNFTYESDEDDKPKQILKNLNFEIKQGEFVAVLGHNGSGKSTAAKMINGLILPLSGSVEVDSMTTSKEENINKIRREVGMVFQNPDNQIVATIVEDDVAFGCENLGVPPEEIRIRVDEALKSVDMFEFRKSQPHNLSGGQKQRVAIAGIIAMKTKCIVMDEPTAMLDPRGRQEVMNTILMLNKNMGINVVLITHYMDEAVKADRVIVLNDGEKVLDGTPREVFTDVEKIKSYGLDVPQSAELAFELRKSGIDLPEGILFEEECADFILKAAGVV